jgi:hypothetical protein
LSQNQVQEIRSLRGRLSAAEVKKRFGIGTTRLYRIWRDGSGSSGGTHTANPSIADRLNRLESHAARCTDVLQALGRQTLGDVGVVMIEMIEMVLAGPTNLREPTGQLPEPVASACWRLIGLLVYLATLDGVASDGKVV